MILLSLFFIRGFNKLKEAPMEPKSFSIPIIYKQHAPLEQRQSRVNYMKMKFRDII
jgi:hypothetical protein